MYPSKVVGDAPSFIALYVADEVPARPLLFLACAARQRLRPRQACPAGGDLWQGLLYVVFAEIHLPQLNQPFDGTDGMTLAGCQKCHGAGSAPVLVLQGPDVPLCLKPTICDMLALVQVLRAFLSEPGFGGWRLGPGEVKFDPVPGRDPKPIWTE